MILSDWFILLGLSCRKEFSRQVRFYLVLFAVVPQFLLNFFKLNSMSQVAKWIEFGGIVSSFVGKAIQELSPQLREWNERYVIDDVSPQSEGVNLQEEIGNALRRKAQLQALPSLTSDEVSELAEITQFLRENGSSSAVSQPAVSSFPQTAVETAGMQAGSGLTAEQQRQIELLRAQGIIS
jgi:hypothetical protein